MPAARGGTSKGLKGGGRTMAATELNHVIDFQQAKQRLQQRLTKRTPDTGGDDEPPAALAMAA
jgi:hypothetical protein